MCRHLAYLGPPRSLSSLLYEPAHSLEHQSWQPRHQINGTLNADGWGVGWWDPVVRREPARYRTTAPIWADQSFRSVAEVVHAGAFAAAVRSATPPLAVVETSSAPFSADGWLFSLNGFVRDFRGPVGEALRRRVTERRAVGLEGTSDAEVLFALVLDALDGGATPEQALAAVVAEGTDATDPFLNLLLSNGHEIVATAWGNSLFVLQDAGLADRGVLVASEPLDDHDEWARVPDGSILRATCAELEISPLTSHGGPE
jgi:glutamine amidotransferase